MAEQRAPDPRVELLRTIPGVGFVLATVIPWEVGDVGRFPTAGHLAAYAGTTPRVLSSGGRTRYLPPPSAANTYPKWAFGEAACVVSLNKRHWRDKRAVRLYQTIRARRGYRVAIGAVAHHLAEAAR
jgi:transposase